LANKAHPARGYLYIAGAAFSWGIAASLDELRLQDICCLLDRRCGSIR
jgi:hypothetical protein